MNTTTETKPKVLNGVDTEALFGTIDAISNDPAIASFQFRVRNHWVDGGENRSTINDYYGAKQEMARATAFELINDEPPVLLGADRGANPVEYVLHALAGCLTTSLVYHAAARGIAVRGVRTKLMGDLDLHGFLGMSDKVRRGFQTIRVVFDIDADVDDNTKLELMMMGQRYSPVFDIVSNGVPVKCMLDDARQSAAA
jgi:uncharacterized OsmC-like protein